MNQGSFAPPPGPPPPQVPEGWKAVWDDNYKTWFYVNIHTSQSQWELPTQPAYPPSQSSASTSQPSNTTHGPPPDYANNTNQSSANQYLTQSGQVHDAKINPYEDEDAKLAQRLQAEEDERARGHNNNNSGRNSYERNQNQGDNSNYYSSVASGSGAQPGGHAFGGGTYTNEPVGQKSGKKGILDKLVGAIGQAKASRSHGGMGGGYGQSSHGMPMGMGGGMMGGGHHGGGMMGGPMMGGGYGRPMYGGGGYGGGRRPGGGGMGMAGGAALGLGAGALGGMAMANAMDDDDYGDGYQEGFDDGGGGDDGGGDGGE